MKTRLIIRKGKIRGSNRRTRRIRLRCSNGVQCAFRLHVTIILKGRICAVHRETFILFGTIVFFGRIRGLLLCMVISFCVDAHGLRMDFRPKYVERRLTRDTKNITARTWLSLTRYQPVN